MPLHLYRNIRESGSVPPDWEPVMNGIVKYPVRNPEVYRYLRELLHGSWRKVIWLGNIGEVHYFEHASGRVAGVKFYLYEE